MRVYPKKLTQEIRKSVKKCDEADQKENEILSKAAYFNILFPDIDSSRNKESDLNELR